VYVRRLKGSRESAIIAFQHGAMVSVSAFLEMQEFWVFEYVMIGRDFVRN
jgi:hypothetical protein